MDKYQKSETQVCIFLLASRWDKFCSYGPMIYTFDTFFYTFFTIICSIFFADLFAELLTIRINKSIRQLWTNFFVKSCFETRHTSLPSVPRNIASTLQIYQLLNTREVIYLVISSQISQSDSNFLVKTLSMIKCSRL